MKKIVLIAILSIQSVFAQVQKGYFIMPINPGQVTSLSGCFGDIRTNHFHAGLDIRTGGVEGKRVVAAADGYISRIKIQNGGYGNALYITHPNGLTTLYAHLKDFNTEIAQYLTEKQYEAKTWEIDVEVPKDLFVYKQGDFVALSGNTGGSAGPHLHFEIRDEKENVLNPELFGFKEIKDLTPPIIEFISLKCMSPDALINGKFGIFNFKAIKTGNTYIINQAIKAKGTIGVEILTYDKSSNSPFRQGVYSIDMQMNKVPAYKFVLNKMSFHNKLDMNVHVNYKRMIEENLKIHKCYVEEGNSFDFYESNQDWGKLKIENPSNEIQIQVKDAHLNTTELKFNIQKYDTNLSSETIEKVDITDHFLNIVKQTSADKIDIVTADGNTISLPLITSTQGLKSAVYSLDEGFPTKLTLGDMPIILPVNTAVHLSKPFIKIKNLNVNFTNALYDNAYLDVSVSDEALVLHDDNIPLKEFANVEWTLEDPIKYPEKKKVYLETGSRRKFIGGNWQENTINFKTRELGTYTVLYDFDPPSITPRIVNKDQLRFTIVDRLSGIKKIECYLNNEWILMDYEYKTGAIWSRKLDSQKPFEGNLVLKITDNCNNSQSYEATI